MSKYKGLFTFDADNHRYVPVEQADGIISDMNYRPEPEEEPKEYWYIDTAMMEVTYNTSGAEPDAEEFNKQIGNYFESEEEAEKAVEKLKAWKRLKDKGLHVTTFYVEDGSLVIRAKAHNSSGAENWEDLSLVFGGEE